MTPTCETCRFYALESAGIGECRRRPPVIVSPVGAFGDGTPDGGSYADTVMMATRWPIIHQDDWCGEHDPKGDATIAPSDLADLDVDARTRTCLRAAGIADIASLARRTELDLLRTRGIGRNSLQDIRRALAARGLELAP